MICRISAFLFLICLVFSCQGKVQKTTEQKVLVSDLDFDPLISAEQLVDVSQDDNIKIIDFRKKEDYLRGHITNALNVWRSDIENRDYPYKGMMAEKSEIQALMRKLGIEEDDTVIIYDDRGSCDAARLWWVLKIYNFDRIRLLNGGWSAWKNIGGDTSKAASYFTPSSFRFSQENRKGLYIDKEGVSNIVDGLNNAILLDTRTVEEYEGIKTKKGAKKGGRIPASINIDWTNTVNNDQKFKPFSELEKIYEALGDDKNRSIVAYCHSGVRSAHTTFILTELLGYKNVKNYDGSWSEWSYFDDLPVEIRTKVQ